MDGAASRLEMVHHMRNLVVMIMIIIIMIMIVIMIIMVVIIMIMITVIAVNGNNNNNKVGPVGGVLRTRNLLGWLRLGWLKLVLNYVQLV